MGVVHGKNGVVSVGAAPGNAVLRLKTYKVTEKIAVADSTVAGAGGDADWETHEPGKKSWSATLDSYRDKSDVSAAGALVVGASVVVNFYDYGTAAGNPYRTGTGTVTSVEDALDMGNVTTQSFEVTGNGPLNSGTA